MKKKTFNTLRNLVSLTNFASNQEDDWEFTPQMVTDVKTLSLFTLGCYAKAATEHYDHITPGCVGKTLNGGEHSGPTVFNTTLGYGQHSFQDMMARAFTYAKYYQGSAFEGITVLIPLSDGNVPDMDLEFEIPYQTLGSSIVGRCSTAPVAGVFLGQETITYNFDLVKDGQVHDDQRVFLTFVKNADQCDWMSAVFTTDMADEVINQTETYSEALTLYSEVEFQRTPISLPANYHNANVIVSAGWKGMTNVLPSRTDVYAYLDHTDFKHWKYQFAFNALVNPDVNMTTRNDGYEVPVIPVDVYEFLPLIESFVYKKITGKWGKKQYIPIHMKAIYGQVTDEIDQYLQDQSSALISPLSAFVIQKGTAVYNAYAANTITIHDNYISANKLAQIQI